MVTSSAVVGSSAMIRSGVEERDRDRHALAHAARELVRIGPSRSSGDGNADHAPAPRAPASSASARLDLRWACIGLDHLRVDAQDRIERHHRILEDHGDAVAAQAPQPLGRGRVVSSSPLRRIVPVDDAARADRQGR